MQFETVFDAMHSGYKDWSFAAGGLIFVAISSSLLFFPDFMQRMLSRQPHISGAGLRKGFARIFCWFLFGFAVFLTTADFISTYGEYISIKHAFEAKNYQVVEGPVKNFVPMPYMGHAMESFSVNGVRFSYSDYLVTNGFNHTTSHGGPIHEGLDVRIEYIKNDRIGKNIIIKLEVAKSTSDIMNAK